MDTVDWLPGGSGCFQSALGRSRCAYADCYLCGSYFTYPGGEGKCVGAGAHDSVLRAVRDHFPEISLLGRDDYIPRDGTSDVNLVHLDLVPQSRGKRSGGGDSPIEGPTLALAYGEYGSGYGAVLRDFEEAGYTEPALQYDFYHNELSGSGVDDAANLLVFVGVCLQRFGADCTVGDGIAGKPGVCAGCGEFCDFLPQRFVWIS